ncbi:MAG: hypothetical protein H6739_15875 [Alphaproteobacteria bacterium]|nr:hypothetical protein [Alphaproteobacteria bacterium]
MTLLLLLLGCTPTCEQTCRKLIRCGEVPSDGVSEFRCTESCNDQIDLYQLWDDTQLQEKQEAARRCVGDNECAQIADGVCYDEDMYIY